MSYPAREVIALLAMCLLVGGSAVLAQDIPFPPGEKTGSVLNADGPFCLTGQIDVLAAESSCDDGATHQLKTFTPETVRLKGHGASVSRVLKELEDAKCHVTVCGIRENDSRCPHLDTYYGSCSDEFNDLILPLLSPHRVLVPVGEQPTLRGCVIVREGDPYVMNLTSVFGPAPRPKCEHWLKENCREAVD